MKSLITKCVCVVLVLLMTVGAVLSVSAAETYTLSNTRLKKGVNTVTASVDTVTIYGFKPTKVGLYKVSVDDPDATLNFWYGTAQYVSMSAQDAVDGELIVTCTAVGQTLLLGLSGVESATITITEQEGYVYPPKVVYRTYVNQHRVSRRFSLPGDPLTAVDITKPQTLVADSKGIYHLDSVDGPIVYVNMRASIWTDLYKLFYPDDVEGEEWPPISTMRGRYDVTATRIYCYEFVDAMNEYADALDDNGYYYLTVDLAKYMQCYGTDQGWHVPRYSPFAPIQQGNFIEESAWLVNTYYVAPEVPEVMLGDVNEDGRINNRDLARLQQYLNEWDVTVNAAAADLNGDGKLNNRDIGLLQQYINDWDVPLG